MAEQEVTDQTPEDETRDPPVAARAGRRTNARHQVRQRAAVQRAEPRADTQRLVRTRRRTENRFHIDEAMIPPNASWEWKTAKVGAQPQDDHIGQLMDNHWRKVDKTKYPNLVTEKDGMILMERPLYLTQDARREDLAIALDQVERVSDSAIEAPSGTMTRSHASVKKNTVIKRDYNEVAIAGTGPDYGDPT